MLENAVVLDLRTLGITGQNTVAILANTLQRCQPRWRCYYHGAEQEKLVVSGISMEDVQIITGMAEAAARVINDYLRPYEQALEHILSLEVKDEDRDNTIDNAFETAAECIATARETLEKARGDSIE